MSNTVGNLLILVFAAVVSIIGLEAALAGLSLEMGIVLVAGALGISYIVLGHQKFDDNWIDG